jgi:hypothetical protein
VTNETAEMYRETLVYLSQQNKEYSEHLYALGDGLLGAEHAGRAHAYAIAAHGLDQRLKGEVT